MNKVRTFQIATVVLAVAALYFAVTDPRSDYLFAVVILADLRWVFLHTASTSERTPRRTKALIG